MKTNTIVRKAISMMLVIVLMLSIIPITSGAYEFNDADDIMYKEAVDVMTAIGVIDEFPGGDFYPDGVVTRAQAAAFITRLLLSRSLADVLPDMPTGFSDVDGVSGVGFAVKYIAYCRATNINIAAGYPEGFFGPNDPVTASQFAVMLLSALGYGQQGEYHDSFWQTRAIVDGVTKGIFRGVSDDIDYTKPATREEITLYAFNALGVDTDLHFVRWDADSNEYVPRYDGGSLYELVYKPSGLEKIPYVLDNFGRPSKEWRLNNRKIASYVRAPFITFYSVFNETDLQTATSGYSLTAAITTYNGVAQAASTTLANIAALSGYGVVVELYANADREIDHIVATKPVLYEVDYVDYASRSVMLYAKLTDPWNPRGEIYVELWQTDEPSYNVLIDLIKCDYVLVTHGRDNAEFAIPEIVSGIITNVTSSGIVTVNGILYRVVDQDRVIGDLNLLGSMAYLVLDQYYNVIYIELEPDREATPNAIIDFINEQLTGLVAGRYQFNNDLPVFLTGTTYKIAESWLGKTLKIVKLSNSAATTASLPLIMQIPSRPLAPSVTVIHQAASGGTGSINGTSSGMEYRAGATGTWSSCSMPNTTGLQPGTYQVRLKATSETFAGTITTVTINPFNPGGGESSVGFAGAVDAALTPTAAEFDKNAASANNKDISITLTLNGKKLNGIKLGTTALTAGSQYTISGNTITFKKEYLASLDIGIQTFVFDVDGGTKPTLTVTITNTKAIVDTDTPLAGTSKYDDVVTTNWFFDAVEYVSEAGMMTGTSSDPMLFSPNIPITRGMVVTVLWRLDGSPDDGIHSAEGGGHFSDVEENAYFYQAVNWAAANGIVSGYGDGRYGPMDNVTREQLAVIFLNYYKHIGEGPEGAWMIRLDFLDLAAISDWALDAVAYCSIRGVITGKPGNIFDPKGNATRAEFATMLMRFMDTDETE